jgi:hypothetical protein
MLNREKENNIGVKIILVKLYYNFNNCLVSGERYEGIFKKQTLIN